MLFILCSFYLANMIKKNDDLCTGILLTTEK
jgi:hypothetical protein